MISDEIKAQGGEEAAEKMSVEGALRARQEQRFEQEQSQSLNTEHDVEPAFKGDKRAKPPEDFFPIFDRRAREPGSLSKLDFHLSLILFLLIIDLAGRYILPSIGGGWFSAVGSLAVPALCFFLGYFGAKTLPSYWIIAGLAVSVASALLRPAFIDGFRLIVFPLDMIITLLLCVALLRPCIRFIERHSMYAYYIILLMLFLAPASSFAFSHGTAAFFMVFYGYLVAHRSALSPEFGAMLPKAVAICGFFSLILVQIWQIDFTILQFCLYGLCSAGMIFWLSAYDKKTGREIPAFADSTKAMILTVNRQWLWIYIAAVLTIQLVSTMISLFFA